MAAKENRNGWKEFLHPEEAEEIKALDEQIRALRAKSLKLKAARYLIRNRVGMRKIRASRAFLA